jgi:hypothetical protein
MAHMKIAKPLLLVSTPVGVVWGLLEAYRLAGGLVILMAAMVGTLGAAAATVVAAIRRERAAERRAQPVAAPAHPVSTAR